MILDHTSPPKENRVEKKNIFGMIISISVLTLVLFSCFDDEQSKKEDSKLVHGSLSPYTAGSISIAKWQGNKEYAITLQFDDSTPGQATLGVPAFISRNITGTWYVNPGRFEFNDNYSSWQDAATAGQELANHSMNHNGAANNEEADYEIGEASRIIWSLRGDSEYGSLIAFNKGGGTDWNIGENDLINILDHYKNFNRQSYMGLPREALSVPSGSEASVMIDFTNDQIENMTSDKHVRLNFHGISDEYDDDGAVKKDYGNAAVHINELSDYLDYLVTLRENGKVWIGGFIEIFKYIKELQNSTITIQKYDDGCLSVNLTSTTDNYYYNEPLTIMLDLPVDWDNCFVKINNDIRTYNITNHQIMFDVVPGSDEILLSVDDIW